jgi:hypothetical protein
MASLGPELKPLATSISNCCELPEMGTSAYPTALRKLRSSTNGEEPLST